MLICSVVLPSRKICTVDRGTNQPQIYRVRVTRRVVELNSQVILHETPLAGGYSLAVLSLVSKRAPGSSVSFWAPMRHVNSHVSTSTGVNLRNHFSVRIVFVSSRTRAPGVGLEFGSHTYHQATLVPGSLSLFCSLSARVFRASVSIFSGARDPGSLVQDELTRGTAELTRQLKLCNSMNSNQNPGRGL